MIVDSAAGPTASPGRAVLVGAGMPATAVGVAVGAVAGVAGRAAAASVWFGAALALGALAVGPLVSLIARNWPPPAVMLAALVGYAVAMTVVGELYASLAPRSWVRGGYAGCGVLATTIVWIVGQIRAVRRVRILAFDERAVPGPAPDQTAGRDADDSPESPGRETG